MALQETDDLIRSQLIAGAPTGHVARFPNTSSVRRLTRGSVMIHVMDTSPTGTGEMRELASASWELYREAEDLGVAALVRPSIPILFFGEDEKYLSSSVKVVTVGLNPSRLEFPKADPFLRFPAARQIDPRQPALDVHLAALRAYFRERPYNGWFRPAFEPILNGLGTSYYDGMAACTALHTDICSPLATDPTWSRLGNVRAGLATAGVELWHRLIERLAPDVILISVARQHLDKIRFPKLGGWESIHSIER